MFLNLVPIEYMIWPPGGGNFENMIKPCNSLITLCKSGWLSKCPLQCHRILAWSVIHGCQSANLKIWLCPVTYSLSSNNGNFHEVSTWSLDHLLLDHFILEHLSPSCTFWKHVHATCICYMYMICTIMYIFVVFISFQPNRSSLHRDFWPKSDKIAWGVEETAWFYILRTLINIRMIIHKEFIGESQ